MGQQSEISVHREKVEKTFWGIYSLQVPFNLFSGYAFIYCLLLVPSMNNPLLIYLAFSLLSRGS